MEYEERVKASKGNFPSLVKVIREVAIDRVKDVDLEKIKYYHNIRNKIYHQGNGITPLTNNAEGYRNIAVDLLNNLLLVDLRPLLVGDGMKNKQSAVRMEMFTRDLMPIKTELIKRKEEIQSKLLEQLHENELEFGNPKFILELKEYYLQNKINTENQRWKSSLKRLANEGVFILDYDDNIITNLDDENIFSFTIEYIDERPVGPPPSLLGELYQYSDSFHEDEYLEIVLADDFTESLILITSHIKFLSEIIAIEDYWGMQSIINWDYEARIQDDDFEKVLQEIVDMGKQLINNFDQLRKKG